MNASFEEILEFSDSFAGAPTLAEMPRRTLADKGVDGPTAAHVVEEAHIPLNLAYITCTTGSSAFQNIVGVTHSELPRRIGASRLALERMGLSAGDHLTVTYPPLVNVFAKEALDAHGIKWSFLERSSREALISNIISLRPKAVIGESSFLRAALEDVKRLGLSGDMPKKLILIAAGTPLDSELVTVAKQVVNAVIHDLYGCQEVGWIALNGSLLRDDVVLMPYDDPVYGTLNEVVAGGIPIGDAFPLRDSGHLCDSSGKLLTYSGLRTNLSFETVLIKTPLRSLETACRVAGTILRIKGRIVRVAPDIVLNASHTVLEIVPVCGLVFSGEKFYISGPEKTAFFDDMAEAQMAYQLNAKTDPGWAKRR